MRLFEAGDEWSKYGICKKMEKSTMTDIKPSLSGRFVTIGAVSISAFNYIEWIYTYDHRIRVLW